MTSYLTFIKMVDPYITTHSTYMLKGKTIPAICAKEENIKIADEAIELIAECAEGGMRDALSLLDEAISFAGDMVKVEDVYQVSGAVNLDNMLDVAECILDKDSRTSEDAKIYQQGEIVNHFGGTEDWYLAVGSYFTCIEMHNVTVKVNADGTKTYSAQLKYTVADFYNWNENSWSTIPIVDVSQRDLHQLHRVGQAKEFLSVGEKEYVISWTKGQTAEQIIK